MPIRRTRMFGGERYLINRHENSTAIKLAIHAVNSSRKSLKKAVELKDKLIKEANEKWKKSANYKPHWHSITKIFIKQRELFIIIYINPNGIIYFRKNNENMVTFHIHSSYII